MCYCVGEGNARGAIFSIFRWICSLAKNILQYLKEPAIARAREEKQITPAKDNKVEPIMGHLINFEEILINYLMINNGKSSEEPASTDLIKEKSCSWKPNKSTQRAIITVILHLLCFNLTKTDKNHVVLRWMISLMEIESTSSSIDEDIAKGTNPSEARG